MTALLSQHHQALASGSLLVRTAIAIVACSLALALCPSRYADAQPSPMRAVRPAYREADTPSRQRARYLREQALLDRNTGLLELAETKLRLAVILWDDPAARWHLALVLIQRGNPVAAAAQLQRVLRAKPAEIAPYQDQDLRRHAAQRLRALEEDALAWVTVTCPTEGAKLYIGNDHVHTVAQGRCGERACPNRTAVRRVATKPGGVHLFVAVMPHGDPPVVVERRLEPGGSYVISFAERRAGRRWRHLSWEPWAVLGSGAFLGTAGAVLQWRAGASYDTFERRAAACAAGSEACDPSAFAHLRRRGDTLRTLGIVGYSIGATAAAAGVALFYLNRRVPYRRRDLTIVPLVEHAGAGALISGRF